MNCKTGDLALIIRHPLAGRLVEVLDFAPAHAFRLPSGDIADGAPPGAWVVKSLGSPFDVWQSNRFERRQAKSMYAVCPDSALRPLPGNTSDDEVTDEREKETA